MLRSVTLLPAGCWGTRSHGEHREEHRARRHAVTLFFLEHGCDLGPSPSGSWPPQHRNEARIAGITLSWGGCGVLGGNAGLPLRFQLWLLWGLSFGKTAPLVGFQEVPEGSQVFQPVTVTEGRSPLPAVVHKNGAAHSLALPIQPRGTEDKREGGRRHLRVGTEVVLVPKPRGSRFGR